MKPFIQFKNLLKSYEIKKPIDPETKKPIKGWSKKANYVDCLAGFWSDTSGAYYVPDEAELEFLTLKYRSRAQSARICLSPRWRDIRPLILDLDKKDFDFVTNKEKIISLIAESFPKSSTNHYVEKNHSKATFHLIFEDIFVNKPTQLSLYQKLNAEFGKNTVDEALVENPIRLPYTFKPKPDGDWGDFVKNTHYEAFESKMTLEKYLGVRNVRRIGEASFTTLKPAILEKKNQSKKIILEDFPETANKDVLRQIDEWCIDRNVSKNLRQISNEKIVWELSGYPCPNKGTEHKRHKTVLIYKIEWGKVYIL